MPMFDPTEDYWCEECERLHPGAEMKVTEGKVLPYCKASYNEKYRESKRESNRRSSLMKKYGLTESDLKSIHDAQNGCCAICGEHEDDCGALVVDHDHDHGGVRGLLCNHCNLALGHSRESLTTLRNMISYLTASRVRYGLSLIRAAEGNDVRLQKERGLGIMFGMSIGSCAD